jgi:hypothetical protein
LERLVLNDLFDIPPGVGPDHAYRGKTDTSVEAAEIILPKTGTLRRRVYDMILRHSDFGATDYELQARLDLTGNTERPRRKELQDRGLIQDSGQRRPTPSGRASIVWVA